MPSAGGSAQGAAPSCLVQAWALHQGELGRWLHHRLPDADAAQDLLQDVFVKALRQGERFCTVANARAWLFEVTRNTLTDHIRRQKPTGPMPDAGSDGGVGAEAESPHTDAMPPVLWEPDTPCLADQLEGCLQRVLTELAPADADIIRQCDLNGMRQQDYATAHGLSLSATKARLQRARLRLRQAMVQGCQIHVAPGGGVTGFTLR